MRYKLGDLVLVKKSAADGSPFYDRMVHEIDGVTEKVINGTKTIRYESGTQVFLESDVEGKVLLEKPRAPRTRKPKKDSMENQLDIKDLEVKTIAPIL